jgi:hypothetical protein
VSFQRVIEHTLHDARNVADPYFDDIIIGSHIHEGCEEDLLRKHDSDLRRVLDLLRRDSFVADKRKCKLFVRSVELCGHVLTAGTHSPLPGKLLALQQWELPPTISALRSFLGMCNYYSTYVPRYAEMAAPMMELLKVGRIEGKKGSVAKVKWTKEGEAGFIALKKALFDSLMVQRLQPDQPFIIHTDASDYAIGAVLSQIDLDRVEHPLTLDDVHHFIDVAMSDPSEKPGHELTDFIQRLPLRPVAFFSRKLTDSQRRTWTPREKEAYAMVSCLKKYASRIAFQHILLLTDHRSLESWATELLDTPSGPAGRKARWHVLLSRFNIHVRYLPGPQNLVADSLSRWVYPAVKGLSDCSFQGSKADQMAMSDIISQERDEETHFSAPPHLFQQGERHNPPPYVL